MITPKDRLLKTMEGLSVDRPPVVCPGGMMNMVFEELMNISSTYLPEAHSDSRKMANLAKAIVENNCFENYGVPFCMTVEAENMGSVIDMGSTIYEPHVVEYLLKSVSDLDRLPKIDFEKGRVKTVLEAIRILKEKNESIPVIGNITGPISLGTSIIDPVTFYKEMRKNLKKCMNFSNL